MNRSQRGRALVVADIYPWPARDGYRLRLQQMIEALGAEYDVDVFAAIREELPSTADDVSGAIRRVHAVQVPERSRSIGLVLETLRSRVPRRILWRDWTGARAALRAFADPTYDVVWYSHADSYVALGHGDLGPTVVDLDNLEDHIGNPSLGRNPSTRDAALLHRLKYTIRDLAVNALDRRDTSAWRHLQHKIVRTADRSILCSELDRSHLGESRIAIVPNGYPDPSEPRTAAVATRIFTMVGNFSYVPNRDGAFWFVEQILPAIREVEAEVEVRFVGRHNGALNDLVSKPGVHVVGEVADLGSELARARAIVVPLRTGSGTRIKVLEALANGIPVVSTAIGCEGLQLEAGAHALVENDPLRFAEACIRLLGDDALCMGLARAGRQLFLSTFSQEKVGVQVLLAVRGAITERSQGQ